MQDKNSSQVLGGFFCLVVFGWVFFENWGISQIRYSKLSMFMRILLSEFPCY